MKLLGVLSGGSVRCEFSSLTGHDFLLLLGVRCGREVLVRRTEVRMVVWQFLEVHILLLCDVSGVALVEQERAIVGS